MATISTKEIIKRIADASKNFETPMTIKDTTTVISLLREVIGDALANGEDVQITGLVNLHVLYRDARVGRNVKTGETMEIPESLMISAKVGKELKDRVRDVSDEVFATIKAKKKK